ncbi:MAG: adenosylmethionine decarboxylase [Candidatus Zambryskibacteria bacterium CG_4_9_14_3_um_filter_42_9]|uniref:Adenosylmethionine decarboxylase n=1 Tax=Candidatus Zambryskibacteria bacterium CG22_combo_CG10-13_8_21_14_all_42_17 TaxID=1975118 RepID=A0A2H0BEE7_9BACT|nr:MAG: adenosylmethionine decarboxylase [Candidatus Zambryskibacteria bacterium CG22_combo_CG10-13_8_21_14_all_42_17]PJA36625.1 MAG: adenosylmethionine decarboxylase [Candidatus Zambryskibacteria bacterium CG_4_9_14_3_um_filter_42_9]
MNPMHFGEHLTIDGYDGDKDLLDDKDLILDILTNLPKELGMGILVGPQVTRALGNDIKDPGGWTGFVVIAESHISIHTFPLRGFVSIDVYTCKNNMDTDFILKYFKDKFGLKDIEENFIKRGTRYPGQNIH